MEVEIYNPKDKPADELPFIYGFNNGGKHGWYHACLMAEDGTPLGSHICSEEGFMPGDLGIKKGTRPGRHEVFRKHYPDGYRMDFVTYEDVSDHEKLQVAFKLNRENNIKAPEGITKPGVTIELG